MATNEISKNEALCQSYALWFSTDYRIEADKTASGTFALVASQDATTPFAPVQTTLNGALTDSTTTVTVTDASNLSQGDYITVEKELIKLGTKATNTFSGCTRGAGGTIQQAHANSSAVYKAHESYTDTAVSFGSRKVIRYKIIRVQGSGQSVAMEAIAAKPPLPPFTNMITLWGIIEDMDADPRSGVTVTLAIGDSDNYGPDTGEVIYKATQTATTDEDGFFSFYVRRDAARIGADAITLTIDPAGSSALTWVVTALPDQNSVNFLLT